jgi:predicted nucleic-acid-binding Zn-ribbon protein
METTYGIGYFCTKCDSAVNEVTTNYQNVEGRERPNVCPKCGGTEFEMGIIGKTTDVGMSYIMENKRRMFNEDGKVN